MSEEKMPEWLRRWRWVESILAVRGVGPAEWEEIPADWQPEERKEEAQ